MAMENGNDLDFSNIHGEALSECRVRIEGKDAMWDVTQRELALWMHMAALELRKTKLAGEAGTYGKGLVDKGHGTAQG